MGMQTDLATTGHELARASQRADGEWQVECFLAGRDVRCLAADSLHPEIIYVGTQGNGVLRSNDRGMTWRSAGLGRADRQGPGNQPYAAWDGLRWNETGAALRLAR